ncbi:MAG: prepilin-type N-terminal cleavage/methylation domain-containing protein [Deltaproteobacteria bacterium]|nr:prepilin-type N-terminal cleavage/methylation domain-containing protein [Deltaproteobacteria bacterium]
MEMKRKQKHISSRCSNQGFTMIELLVAMVVSLLAMGAIYSTFLAQHRSYRVQEETAEMQQNIRTAMFYMQREIRMAGSDPFNVGGIGITAANAGLITFTEDVRGADVGAPPVAEPPDGDVGDPNENITYSLDANNNLVRNAGAGNQIVAQNINALDFVYLDDSSPPNVLNAGGGNVPAMNYGLIRSVEITIVARTDDPLLFGDTNTNAYFNQQGTQILVPQNDKVSRRRLTALIHCRNIGL